MPKTVILRRLPRNPVSGRRSLSWGPVRRLKEPAPDAAWPGPPSPFRPTAFRTESRRYAGIHPPPAIGLGPGLEVHC
ncbi:MAG: hypothetical protein DWQ01_17820 [Planctomycetota bacterium]|nr:MAG: hypothetical protein DWQ01_17820 [Planctomycetota bacterium]